MIRIADLFFTYQSAGFAVQIERLDVAAGERCAIIGPSGAGKTTLINLIAGMLTPQRGGVWVDGVNVSALSDAHRRRFRAAQIGFVFQEFELLEYLRVADNILLPYRLSNALRLTNAVRQRASQLAEAMGVAHLLRRYPARISHGERQRVALCRALIAQPKLLLTDEPTGNLDPATAGRVLDLLLTEAQRNRATLLTVTHNHEFLARFERTIEIRNYTVADDSAVTAGASA